LQYFISTPHVHCRVLWHLRGRKSARSGGHWSLFNASDLVGADHPDGAWNDEDDYYDHVAGLGASGEVIAAQFDHP
jgi:hypothetical protein